MLVLHELYDPKTWLAMQAKVADSNHDLRQAPMYLVLISACIAGILLISFVEFHMITSLFGDLVEETETAFTPAIMALTAPVMILGFHAMASYYPNSLTVRFIRGSPRLFIPLYLLGISLIIGGLIYDRGLLSLLSEGGEIDFPTILEAAPESWTDWFISTISNPVAALLFSLGIGGLAVVNIFVADFLLHKIKEAVKTRHAIIQRAQQIKRDYDIVRACVAAYEQIDFDLADLNRLSDDVLAEEQGISALDAITDELAKPKINLLNAEYEDEQLPFLSGGKKPLDPKPLKAAIAKIEAIDLKTIIHWMEAPKTLPSNPARK